MERKHKDVFVIIADDITGAAEIAGTALRYGISTSLITEAGNTFPDSEIIVYATDIRSCNSQKAQTEIQNISYRIKGIIETDSNIKKVTLFKKTDSALRGHIALELNTIMNCFNLTETILLAQNPSKGRIIKNGTYYINNEKLSHTMFRKDPEFPAFSSNPLSLVFDRNKNKYCNGELLSVEEKLSDRDKNRIYIAEAASEDDIKKQINKAQENTLIAGGADAFEAFIGRNSRRQIQERLLNTDFSLGECANGKILIVSGSTQGKSIMQTALMKKLNSYNTTMPDDVFEGADPTIWIKDIKNNYLHSDAFIMQVGKHEFKGSDYAVRLRETMGIATKELINLHSPKYLIIEGGATAFSILNHIRWNNFKLKHEFSPGVVGMKYGSTEVILKPGSYPWGDLFA